MTEIANADEYEAWNGDSGHRWVADADRRDRVVAPVADALLAASCLTPGEVVVDIGCGCGATTLAAARAVGPTGSAVGIDLSEPMLGVARRRAEAGGLSNITLLQGDAQTYDFDGRSDVALSRFGTMFFADQVAALANIRRGLRPGGRLCIATWQPLGANDWLTIPGRGCTALQHAPRRRGKRAGHARPVRPGGSRTGPARGQVRRSAVPVRDTDPRPRRRPDEATDYLAGTGPGRAALDAVPEGQRPAALAAVRAALAEHMQPDGIRLGASIWIITAGNPACYQ